MIGPTAVGLIAWLADCQLARQPRGEFTCRNAEICALVPC